MKKKAVFRNYAKIINLLNKLPPVPEEYQRHSKAGDVQIDKFAERVEFLIPDQLRSWLKIADGVFIGNQQMLSLLEIESIYEYQNDWREKMWIPIATDGTGNTYIIPVGEEYGMGYPVFFYDCYDDFENPSYIVASDLAHFLEFFMEDELRITTLWPFNKEYVIGKDPDIINFPKLTLPWEA